MTKRRYARRGGFALPENDPDPPLPGSLQFMRLLWALHHQIQSHSKKTERLFGITAPQRFVLRVVGHYENISPGDLARVMHIDPSTLSGILRRLESRTLIRRGKVTEDGRRVVLSLTPAGRRANRHKGSTVEGEVDRVLGSLPPRDLKTVGRVMEMMTDALGKL